MSADAGQWFQRKGLKRSPEAQAKGQFCLVVASPGSSIHDDKRSRGLAECRASQRWRGADHFLGVITAVILLSAVFRSARAAFSSS